MFACFYGIIINFNNTNFENIPIPVRWTDEENNEKKESKKGEKKSAKRSKGKKIKGRN